jgi:hypothetical protein
MTNCMSGARRLVLQKSIPAICLLFVVLIACSCDTAYEAQRFDWVRTRQLRAEAGRDVHGDWRNSLSNDIPGYRLWNWFGDGAGASNDIVRIEVDPEKDKVTAALIRYGIAVDQVTIPVSDYERFVALPKRTRAELPFALGLDHEKSLHRPK